ncbi:PspC domain-containing protein [Acinetobacter pullicarnis]|mgnify:FL=1|uniref:PspC domain-containing protein n=1 Tax=Acinetobacter pullicarnis TaxID=2576829 RepID=UPI0011240E1D|nr:PspC domain-containing protein [Acinetobacter pullicarnis]
MRNNGLYRSNQHKMIAGVMGGIAERFGWDVTILRIVFVLISIFSAGFPGILVYLILWFVIPKQNLKLTSTAEPINIRTVYDEQQYKR